MARETVARTYKVSKKTAKLIEDLAEENNKYKSEIVDKAVQELADKGRDARLESKVDELLAIHRSGTHAFAEDGENEKTEQDDTRGKASPVDKRANEMYSILLRRVNEDDRDAVDRKDLEQAVASVVSRSDYALDQYVPMLEERLRNDGWDEIEHTGSFARTENAVREVVAEIWNQDGPTLKNPTNTNTDALRSALRRVSDNQGHLISNDVADGDTLVKLVSEAYNVVEHRENQEDSRSDSSNTH